MRMDFTNIKVGILGGGQLARMLVLKGFELGLKMYVLCPNENEPAAQICRQWISGSPDNEQDLKKFFKLVDYVTFESEFLNSNVLNRASEQSKIKILPVPNLMAKLQDRLPQKLLLQQTKIPTAEFIAISNYAEAEQALKKFKNGMVIKKRRFGYDGYGTFIIKQPHDLENIRVTLENTAEGFIAEAFVPFKREMAISVVSNGKDIVFLPLVESFQKDARCLWVKGPRQHSALKDLQKKIRKFILLNNYQGILAFELFDTGKKLLVNELAPRVHNSAHYSLDGLTEDQFTLHLKAILSMPLQEPKAVAGGFAMYNLLGQSFERPSGSPPPGVHLHWYGKRDNRHGRKMGHLNAIAKSPDTALKILLAAQKEFKL